MDRESYEIRYIDKSGNEDCVVIDTIIPDFPDEGSPMVEIINGILDLGNVKKVLDIHGLEVCD